MAFVGDIMMHDEQRQAGFETASKTYSFETFFEKIKDAFEGKDIVFGNLETPVAGEALRYTGYPMFNTPEALLEALSKAHFSHLSLANNHALDRRAQGLKNTILAVKEHGFVGIGAQETSTENRYILTEKNGVSLGFLAYTYATNGLTLPPDAGYMLNYIDEAKIKEDITKLKQHNPDLVIVSLHFGDEYKRTANTSQVKLVQSLCNAGADIIIGSHPHVLEPTLFLNKTDGTKCFVTYSLGNFVSGMDVVYTDLGGILEITAKKESGQIYLTPHFIPTWVRRGRNTSGKQTFQILKLSDATTGLSTEQQRRVELYKTFVEKDIVKFEQNIPVLLK
jgi:poly-gamma-glutamate synthesis protein (capsule biosynthesis protein)